MTPFDSILLPLDGSPEAAKAAGCAVWLAERLGATLHVLHSTPRPLPPAEALKDLSAPVAQRARTVLHQTSSEPVRAALDQMAEQDVKLVVMSARGGSAGAGLEPARQLGRIARALLEESTIPPIVLVPLQYREVLPWRSMLVAASGEPAADDALAVAARLSSALELGVSVVHVAGGATATPLLGRYADAPQHELPWRLKEMVRGALADLSPKERGSVEAVGLRSGDTVAELLAEVEQRRSSVLALGWHGAVSPKRALVFKGLVERAECPLLLVREAHRPQLRLKVGDAFGER
jgi:nucleotide-binding universal stress UspA family protein